MLSPPNSSDDDDFAVNIYGAFMSIASIFLFCSIYSVFQIYDAFSIHTVTDEDIINFILNHCYSIDIQQVLMFLGVYTFFGGLLCGVWLLYNNVVALIITIFGVATLVAITVNFQLVTINTMKRENSNEI